MHSRARLLIEKEFRRLCEDPPWGIEAVPLDGTNLFEWTVKILPLQGTIWEGGIFRVYLKFDEHYSVRPPYVQFSTIPFHPNIDPQTGVPCVDFLDSTKLWDPNYTISSVLLAVQMLLTNPVWENAVNPDATEIFSSSPMVYRQIIADCVKTSQRKEAGLVTFNKDTRVSLGPGQEPSRRHERVGPTPSGVKATKLPFEEYYITWCGIATSKSTPEMENALLQKIRTNPVLQRIHIGLPEAEIEEQINKQLREHEVTMYGRMFSKAAALEEKAAKVAQLQKMKKIYLPPRVSPVPPHQDTMQSADPAPVLPTKEDTWEREADDLVAWTKNLDSTAIDA